MKVEQLQRQFLAERSEHLPIKRATKHDQPATIHPPADEYHTFRSSFTPDHHSQASSARQLLASFEQAEVNFAGQRL